MNSKNDSTTGVAGIPIYRNLKEFEKNLPNTIELLETSDGDKIYIVGTAHFSLKSRQDVSLAMRNVLPNAVVLELCPLRLHILQLDENILLDEAINITPNKIKEIITEHGFIGGMFYLSFLKTSANITRQLKIAPGGECRRAIEEANKLDDCKILLGDRPINITFKRALAGLSLKQKLRISYLLNFPNNLNDTISQENIEKLKNRNTKSLEALEKIMPTMYRAFIKERDYILAHSLMTTIKMLKQQNHNNNLKVRIVGVVGMGHMHGIKNNFGRTTKKQVTEYMKMPTGNRLHCVGTNMKLNMNMLSLALKHLKYSVTKMF